MPFLVLFPFLSLVTEKLPDANQRKHGFFFGTASSLLFLF